MNPEPVYEPLIKPTKVEVEVKRVDLQRLFYLARDDYLRFQRREKERKAKEEAAPCQP